MSQFKDQVTLDVPVFNSIEELGKALVSRKIIFTKSYTVMIACINKFQSLREVEELGY